MFKHILSLALCLCLFASDLSSQVFLKNDGNVAMGADSTEHPLEIHSPETAFDTFDIVLGILAESSKRPAIQFAELDPIRPTSGMSIEYDGRQTGGNNRMHIRGVDGSVQYTFKSFASFGVGTSDPNGGIHVVHNSPNAFSSPNMRITESEYDFARLKFDNTAMPGALWDIAGLADTVPGSARLNFFYGRQSPFIGRNVMTLTGDGNMGVGVDSAEARVHIRSEAGSNVLIPPHLRITEQGDGFTRIKMESEAQLNTFWEQGTFPNADPDLARYNVYYLNQNTAGDVLSLTGSGLAGIGTSNPDGRLHIVHNSTNGFFSPNLRITESEYDFARIKMENTDQEGTSWDIAALADSTESDARLNFFYARESPLLGRNVMSLTGEGFVGIGTEAPETPLEIVHADKPALTLTKLNTGVTDVYIQSDDESNPFWRESYSISSDPTRCEYNLFFHPNDSTSRNVLNIDDEGQVGVGTFSPSNKLDVRSDGSINSPEIVLGLISNTSNRPVLQFSESTTASPTSGMSIEYYGAPLFTPRLSFRSTAAADVFRFDNNGNAYKPGGGNWSVLSDRRLKNNIEDYNRGLAVVNQIRPVAFNYNKQSGYPTDKVHVGVIAQELEAVAPSMVESFTVEPGQDYLTVDNSEMIYMLINAVKELSEQNSRQQDLIDELLEAHKTMHETLVLLQESKVLTSD